MKQTRGGRAYIGNPVEAPPYPGAKLYFLMEELENREWLSELIRITPRVLVHVKARRKEA